MGSVFEADKPHFISGASISSNYIVHLINGVSI